MTVQYESGRLVDGIWIENPKWGISMQITRHEDACAIRGELRRTARPAVDPDTGREYEPDRRLQLSREAACTCGRGSG